MNRGFQTPLVGYLHGSRVGYCCTPLVGYNCGSLVGYDSPSLYPLEKLVWMVDFVNNYNQKGKSVLTGAASFLADALEPA